MASVSINYIELPATNIEATKKFFTDAFGWGFVDYGPDFGQRNLLLRQPLML